jgi:hypothetical protein
MRWIEMNAAKCSLIICLFIVFFHSAAGEVTTLTVITDNGWKCLDFENDGWTSNYYDDSWWESAEEGKWNSIESSKLIRYPGELGANPSYFRDTFSIDGAEILNGKFYVGSYYGGDIYIYINDNPLDKITAGTGDPAIIDITSYLQPGKNVIAAKVDLSDSFRYWALVGKIRYDKSTSGQPVT